LLRAIAILAGVYLVIGVVAFLNGSATLIAVPLIPVFWLTERVKRPPSFRLRLALRRLQGDFAGRSPAIVDARVEPWTDDPLRVSLVCSTDAERPGLASQLTELQARISAAAIDVGVAPVSTGFKLNKNTGENCTLGCDSSPISGLMARVGLCGEKWRPYLP
jgi:hypothetical protein